MNLEKLKQILNSNMREDFKEILFFEQLSKEEDIIPKILQILQVERARNKEIIFDMNHELSRAFNYVHEAAFDKKKKGFNKEFLLGEIKNFYRKYKSSISHTARTSEWAKENLADVYPEDLKKSKKEEKQND